MRRIPYILDNFVIAFCLLLFYVRFYKWWIKIEIFIPILKRIGNKGGGGVIFNPILKRMDNKGYFYSHSEIFWYRYLRDINLNCQKNAMDYRKTIHRACLPRTSYNEKILFVWSYLHKNIIAFSDTPNKTLVKQDQSPIADPMQKHYLNKTSLLQIGLVWNPQFYFLTFNQQGGGAFS